MTILEQRFLETMPRLLSSIDSELKELNARLSCVQVKAPTDILRDSSISDVNVTDSAIAAGLLRHDMANLDHEEIWIIILNAANMPIKKMLVSIGDLSSTIIDKRRIVHEVIDANGKSIILAHNHPSQDPNPSKNDIQITEELRACLKLFDFELIDHLILCQSRYFSFADSKQQPYRK